MVRRRSTGVLVLLLSTGGSLFAQGPRRPTHFDQPLPMPRPLQEETAPVGNMIFGGLVGGALGFFALGFAGAVIADAQSDGGDGFEALGGFVIGALAGEAIMLPLGVHVANRGRGEYAASLLASVGIAAVGISLTGAMEDMAPVFLPAIPIAQLATTIAIERKTTR